MAKSFVLLLSIVLICFWAVGCDEDTPTDPGGGGGGTANQAPGTPTIDTGAGGPADASAGKAISTQLFWDCSDPDGDALTFDVSFGTGATPPSVATGQSAESYNPGTLAYSTTYYWQITAEDPDGLTTSSAVWSFTTMAQPSETVSIPNTPTGPANAETTDNPRFDTGGAISSEGHTVEYRFDWDDGDLSTWSTSTYQHHGFDTPGTYNVKAQARCRDHTGVESVWSAGSADIVIAAAAEYVHRPLTPGGPMTGSVGDTQDYAMASGQDTDQGHTVEFRYDWDDGSYSDWSTSLSASHIWTVAGSYYVTVTGRCSIHTSILSDPSPSLNVVITDAAETVSAPTHMSSSTTRTQKDVSIWVSTSGATSSFGHDVEYRIDFDDGSMSDWGVTAGEWVYHSWAANGVYAVKGQARCIADTLVVSDWSAPRNITIIESVSVPLKPTGPTSGLVGATLTYTTGGGACSYGHPVEYMIRSYKSGTYVYSDWSASPVIDHVFATSGTHYVYARARCSVNTEASSNWSSQLTVTISDP